MVFKEALAEKQFLLCWRCFSNADELRCLYWTPNFLKAKAREVLLVRRGKVSDTVVPKGEREAGVDDLTEASGGLGGPVPEGLGDLGFVVAELPGGIRAEGIAEGRGFLGCLGHFEDGWIAELHVEFHQHEAAEQEALLSRSILLKEPLGGVVLRRIGVRGVEEEVRVSREDHEPER